MFKKWIHRLMAVSAVAIGLASSVASATPFPGPDTFGYTSSSIAYNQRSMTGSSFAVNGDDNSVGGINLGFNFSFYGTSYSSAWISTNGLIGFNPNNQGSYCCSGNIPNVASSIAPMWMDWITTVTTLTTGTVGSREFIVNWSGSEFGRSGSVDMQLILHEGTNDIEFQYTSYNNAGHQYAIGITDSTSQFLGSTNSPPSADARSGICISSNGTNCGDNTVPEPGMLALFGLALAGAGFARRRKA